MESRVDYATPELRALLHRRLKIVEGNGRVAATSPPSHGPRSQQGGIASAPVRLPQSRQPPTVINGTGRGTPLARSTHRQAAPVFRNGTGYNGFHAFDVRSSELEIPQARVNQMEARNHALSAEVEKMKGKLMEDGGSMLAEERKRLLQEADELLAETDRMQNSCTDMQYRRDRDRTRKAEAWQSGIGSQSHAEVPQVPQLPQRQGAAQGDYEALVAQNAQLEAELTRMREAESRQAHPEIVSLHDEIQKLRQDNADLRKEGNQVSSREADLEKEVKRLEAELAEVRAERDRYWEAGQASPASSGGGSGGASSESRLRAVMTSQSAGVEELRQAIASVDSLLDEAKRELERKMLRERRAAFEQLHHAMDKADEELLEAAIAAAQKAGVDDEDIVKGQAKLLDLQSMTPEERAARARREEEMQRKKDAFQMVKKDDAAGLEALLDSLDESVRWQDWRDYAGRTLVRCAGDLRAARAKTVLAERIKAPQEQGILPFGRQRSYSSSTPAAEDAGKAAVAADASAPALPGSPPRVTEVLSPGSPLRTVAAVSEAGNAAVAEEPMSPTTQGADRAARGTPPTSPPKVPEIDDDDKPPLPPEEEEKLKAQALRAVVQDDCDSLLEVLTRARKDVWSRWENKAGKDLLTLSQERGSSSVYSLLAKSLGMVKEVKREAYEERQTVWVFVNGDVQPRRATVLEDTPEEADEVLVEYWDGDEPPQQVDRCMVRAMWS
eukprot:TRINITY_DN9704_c0_g1_i1.p1 TRINITY_DN9704_c0_g1~~TRINITY_DN9704_c0_g1_i1.p1  ORF type:complete len:727 (-),score=186.97 TRINITY_DN9704_c0_g1_i1:216-2396(-)